MVCQQILDIAFLFLFFFVKNNYFRCSIILHQTMKLFDLILCLLILLQPAFAQNQEKPVRVACVGNSITFGAGIHNRDRDSYPAQLSQMLGQDYEVRNYGVSARTLLKKGNLPYTNEPMYKQVLEYKPNIVIIKLGTNDTKPGNWQHKASLEKDLTAIVSDFESLSSKPTIYLCYPATAYTSTWGINDSIIVNGVIPVIDRVAKKKRLQTIDLHTATSGMEDLFPDKIHPNEKGATAIAEVVYQTLTGEKKTYIPQAFPGFKSEWSGHERYDFLFNERDVIVVTPEKAAKGKPWIWRPAFFDAFASVDKALLKKGFHVVYYDLTHLYGSPRSVSLGTDFYHYMKNYYGVSEKVTLEGFSRGGLFAINWAVKNPEKVACIYLDAPVCNVFSWPGRSSRPDYWAEMLKEWQITDQEMNQFKGNPVDNLSVLAQAGIPIMAVCGDSDQVVPLKDNMHIVYTRYLALGGPVEMILKPGVDHHPHSLEKPEPVVDFIVRNQPEYKKYQHIVPRGNLNNSFIRFEKERKGRVAFVGGSITEMNGWKDMIEAQLQQRFPYTEFEFIEAGISSTGTTPGAFRLDNDVLSKGKVDLLFVEAAVNDDTNHFNATEQVRGMEGEVRHALDVNPMTDIVMLHFIYDPFISLFAQGKCPDVILNHERVANHYLIPSINLAQEISERMQDGEFTWEQFGGTHPSPFGHTFYAAAINRLFDQMWSSPIDKKQLQEKEKPACPLDEFSYTQGKFIDIRDTKIKKGWKIVDNWNPDDNFGKRKGFVNTPMLEANRPGDQLTLAFTGKAIGIFCAAGPSAGILEYSIDGSKFKKLDTYTEWSSALYIPWVYMLETELENKKHTLILRISKDKNTLSQGTQCVIRNFVINQ